MKVRLEELNRITPESASDFGAKEITLHEYLNRVIDEQIDVLLHRKRPITRIGDVKIWQANIDLWRAEAKQSLVKMEKFYRFILVVNKALYFNGLGKQGRITRVTRLLEKGPDSAEIFLPPTLEIEIKTSKCSALIKIQKPGREHCFFFPEVEIVR